MNTKKKNFVGHITYPYNDVSREFFFYSRLTKKVASVFYDGKAIANYSTKITQSSKVNEMLHHLGYEVKTETLKDSGSHISKTAIHIPCANTDCRHYNERTNGMCRVGIKAKVDRIYGANKTLLEKNIVVSYGARDIREVTTKSECLIWYVKESLGEVGVADVYGKMELC